jgi:glycerol-3-phosphate dehydrogenase (NAD(P)+)
MAVVAVLGAGRMGTAFCAPLLDRGHEVRLVGTHLDVAYIDALRENGVHPGLGHPLPDGASFHQLEELGWALNGADMLVLGVSSAGISWAAETLAQQLTAALPLCMVTKGLEWDGSRLRLLPDVLVERLPEPVRSTLRPVAVTGPCIAGELIRRRDTCVVFAGRDAASVNTWIDAAETPYYHVWPSAEFEGCEASAALKNAFAVGVGFAAGALERAQRKSEAYPEPAGVAAHNVEAAVFAQAISEMSGLVGLVGGDSSTPFGLVGVGDLLVTLHARSVRLGRLLGSGRTFDEAVLEMAGETLEGAATIETFGEALEAFDASGWTTPAQFPLMRHLVSVIGGAQVSIPFDQFFGGRMSRSFGREP